MLPECTWLPGGLAWAEINMGLGAMPNKASCWCVPCSCVCHAGYNADGVERPYVLTPTAVCIAGTGTKTERDWG